MTRDDVEIRLSPMQLAFVATVYGHEAEKVSKARIAWLLWKADDDQRSRHRISQLLYNIARHLEGASLFVSETDEVRGLGEALVRVDTRFLEVASNDQGYALEPLLAKETFLGGLTRIPTDEFADWSTSRAITIRRRLRDRSAQAYSQARNEGDWTKARVAAYTMLNLDPHDESVLQDFMESSVLYGAPGEAEAAYRSFHEMMLLEDPSWKPSERLKSVLLNIVNRSILQHSPKATESRYELVGRGKELTETIAAAGDVPEGEARVILIEGELGIGKTRFLKEITHLLNIRGMRVFSGCCSEVESVIPLNPLLEALRAGTSRCEIAKLSEPWRSVISPLLPDLTTGERKVLPYVTPSAVPRRTFEGLRMLLQTITSNSPAAIVIDDFHCSDVSSAAALEFIFRRWEGGPLIAILAVRPEAVKPASLIHSFISSPRSVWLTLGALPENDARDLLRHVIGKTSTQELENRILRLSGLNPLYLTELAHEAREGHLRGPGESAVPSSIHHVIARRLDSISEQARMILEVVAIAGSVSCDCLCVTASSPPITVLGSVEELRRARLLQQSDGRIVFTHDVIRHYVYQQCSLAARQFWHGRLADYLAGTGADPGELAYHYSLAGDARQAYSSAAAAADTAEGAGALPEAIHFTSICLTSAPSPSAKVEWLSRLAHLEYVNGDFLAAAATHDQVGHHLRSTGDLAGALRSDLERADALGETAVQSQEECLRLLTVVSKEAVDTLADWEIYHVATELRMKVLERLGRTREIGPLLEEVRDASASGTVRARCLAACTLSLCHLFQKSEGRESVCSAEAAYDAAVKLGQEDLIARAFARRFVVLVNMGMLRLPRYKHLIEENLAFSENTGDYKQRYNAHTNAAVFLMDAGEHVAAATHLERAKEAIRGEVAGTEYRNWLCNLGDFHLSLGEYEEALEAFGKLQPLLKSAACKKRILRFGTAGLGLAAFRCGDTRTARMCEEKLGEVLGDTYYDAFPVHAFKAEMLRKRGRSSEAMELLDNYATAVEGRLQLSWLKTRLLQLRLMRKLQYRDVHTVAAEGRDVARTLGLKVWERQLAALAAR